MFLNIKKLRKEKKLTQQEVADKIGVSVRMYSEYENETTDIGVKKLQNIAETLNCELSELFNEKKTYKTADEERKVSEPSYQDQIIAMQKEIIEDLKKDKKLLTSLIETKLGNQEAS